MQIIIKEVHSSPRCIQGNKMLPKLYAKGQFITRPKLNGHGLKTRGGEDIVEKPASGTAVHRGGLRGVPPVHAPLLIFAEAGVHRPLIFAEIGLLTVCGHPGAAAFLLKKC